MPTPPLPVLVAAIPEETPEENQHDGKLGREQQQVRPSGVASAAGPPRLELPRFPIVHPSSIPATPPPTGPAPLLLALGRAGIELAPHPTDPARLRHRPAVLPPDLAERLRLHRAAVLGLLVRGCAPLADADVEYVLVERLGIADDLGMPTHPGAPAWLVAVGESMGGGCEIATHGVDCGHGSTDGGHSGGGEGERPDALRNRERRGSGP